MLVPTTIAYVGEPVAFDVPMGTGWSTRILILTGKFEKLSLAVYGETAVDQPVEPATYHSNQLPFIEPAPISTSLDPAVDRDPTGLAYALLTLIPDAPPLPLIIRLMFTLKPANDDWDLPDFPYIHPNLEEDGEFDMQMAAQLANRPVSDETAYGSLRAFADRIAGAVGPKSVDQAYDTANLLARVAPQHPDLARLIVDRLNFRSIFDASTVEDDTLSRLLVAASNPDIARALSEAQIADYLRPEHKARLSFRIEGWSILSDALWNTQADFDTARKFLLEVGTDEASFGVVLHALIQHSDLSDRLAENSVLPDTSLVADPEQEIGSHDEFIAYLRAWLGVACVLSVYAWADSLPVVRGRERALGILNVWQGYKGYREIVNHLMLTRQMLFRLDCMMDDEEPSRSGVLAERILLALSRFPTSFKSQYLVKTILGLPSGLTVIDDEERLALRDLAYLTDDGLPGAIQEVSSPPERPISPRNLLALRVALVIIAKELRKGGDGELAALRTLWEQDGHGLALYLAESLSVLSADLTTYFSTSPPPSGPLEHIGNLFNAANELMRELQELVPAYRLPGRALRALVVALCDVFACADAADFRFSPGSEASTAAQRSRRRSIDLTRLLVLTKDGKLFTYAETTFRTLLRHASEPGNRDPAYHVTQVLGLIDYLLPMPQEAAMAIDQEELALNWVTPILPRVLTDLTAFFRILDPDSRAHFLLRIADIDDGQVGVGEWLLLDELKRLQSAAEAASSASDAVSVLRQYEMTISLKLLYGIFATHTPCASRLLEYAAGTSEPVAMMMSALNTLLSKRLFSPLLVEVAEHLLDLWSDSFNVGLRFSLALVFLRGVQQPDSSTSRSSLLKSALIALEDVPVRFVDPERLCNEVRDILLILSMSPESSSDAIAWSTVMVVNWLIKQSHAGLPQLSTLRGISMDTLGELFDRFAERLDADAYARLEHIRSTITTPDEDIQVQPSTLLPDTLELPLSDLDAVLRSGIPPPLTPKRTTPPHAQSVFSLVMVSPPTALLRSPAVTGLTKTYNANDFRTLRQTPSARQNTSRLPSRHVDDFEMVSPQMLPEGLPVPPQFVAGDGAFGGLAPPFGGM